jgi:acetolactate synthase-1/3 small subunit
VSGAAAAVQPASDVEPDGGPPRHLVSALVIDRPGTLNRISGLLRARSFNIESLTVGTTHEDGRSRMTIAVRGDDAHLRQVLAQLERLIDVLEVTDLTAAPRLEFELALVEVRAPRTDADRRALDGVLAAAGGETLSTDHDAWRLRLTATPDRIDDALDALRGHGLRSLVRAGAVAMAAGNADSPAPSSTNGATNG